MEVGTMPQLTLRRLDLSRSSAVTAAAMIIRYDVVGLPHGDKATIFRFGSSWHTLRSCNDVSGDWEGPYPTHEKALTALQREFPDVKPCSRRGRCFGSMLFRDELRYGREHV